MLPPLRLCFFLLFVYNYAIKPTSQFSRFEGKMCNKNKHCNNNSTQVVRSKFKITSSFFGFLSVHKLLFFVFIACSIVAHFYYNLLVIAFILRVFVYLLPYSTYVHTSSCVCYCCCLLLLMLHYITFNLQQHFQFPCTQKKKHTHTLIHTHTNAHECASVAYIWALHKHLPLHWPTV